MSIVSYEYLESKNQDPEERNNITLVPIILQLC
jgi:hypothetical protein